MPSLRAAPAKPLASTTATKTVIRCNLSKAFPLTWRLSASCIGSRTHSFLIPLALMSLPIFRSHPLCAGLIRVALTFPARAQAPEGGRGLPTSCTAAPFRGYSRSTICLGVPLGA